MPVYNPVLQLLRGGRAAYKSMSWSTSSRERAKLGRLDSEPPLLLREWPPETGRRDKGDTGKQRGGKAGEWESQRANTAVKERGRKDEKREREKERKRGNLPIHLYWFSNINCRCKNSVDL